MLQRTWKKNDIQITVRSVPENDSKRVQTIEVDIWKKEKKVDRQGTFFFSSFQDISSLSMYGKHDPYEPLTFSSGLKCLVQVTYHSWVRERYNEVTYF